MIAASPTHLINYVYWFFCFATKDSKEPWAPSLRDTRWLVLWPLPYRLRLWFRVPVLDSLMTCSIGSKMPGTGSRGGVLIIRGATCRRAGLPGFIVCCRRGVSAWRAVRSGGLDRDRRAKLCYSRNPKTPPTSPTCNPKIQQEKIDNCFETHANVLMSSARFFLESRE